VNVAIFNADNLMNIYKHLQQAIDRAKTIVPQRKVDKLLEFRRIIGAVLIQDMRSRFGHSHLGYLIQIAWPLTHLCVITAVYLFRTSIAPVGDSPTLFIATGGIPYILCLYPARLMAMSIPQNRQLLNIPIIRPLHLMISRSILETLNALIVMSIFMSAIYLFDVDVFPMEPTEAAAAIGAAVFLGVGIGFFNVVMCALVGPYFLIVFIFSMIVLYAFSGVYLPATAMPASIRAFADYNPILHLVEWLRSAYYTSYDSDQINRALIFWVGGICLSLGLIGERFLRGKFTS
jgi:capsular polysaccharide transport system permease protein